MQWVHTCKCGSKYWCSDVWTVHSNNFNNEFIPFTDCIMRLNRLLYTYLYLCLLAVVPRVHSQLYVLTVCTVLQFPCPTADTALTLTLYLVSAFSPVRILNTAEVEELVQEGVSFVYWTWYWEIETSLWGMVQFTNKTCCILVTVIARDMLLIVEGTVAEIQLLHKSM